MAAPPANGHTDEFEQLAGLSALDVLEGDERARFEAHAAECARCRLMVRRDRQALANLALTAPEMDPSPDFKERLMRRAAEELAAQGATAEDAQSARRGGDIREQPAVVRIEEVERPARRGNIIQFRARQRWISALAAVLVIGLVSAGAFTYQNQPVATYTLAGSVSQGSATVIVRRSGAAELDMRGLPSPGQGLLYEAWIIPPGKQPVAAGTTQTGDATLPLSGNLGGSTIAITREQRPVDAPTSTPILAAVVQL